jgi:hypothetical protein
MKLDIADLLGTASQYCPFEGVPRMIQGVKQMGN